MHYYTLYHLTIASQVPLTGISETDRTITCPDITITLADTPQTLSVPPTLSNVCHDMARNELLFCHEALGMRIYASCGNRVIVDRACYKNPDLVSLYLLGSIMGALLYMRGMAPMHAAAVKVGCGAVLILGHSGAGKSSLALGLSQRGYPVLCDDQAPVRIEGDRVIVYPGRDQLKVWQDTLAMADTDPCDLAPVRPEENKFFLPLVKTENAPLPVTGLICLGADNQDAIRISPVKKALDRLPLIHRHFFRRPFIKGLEREDLAFATATGLARLPMTRILRNQSADLFDTFLDQVEDVLG